jgi:hypothetical protein
MQNPVKVITRLGLVLLLIVNLVERKATILATTPGHQYILQTGFKVRLAMPPLM